MSDWDADSEEKQRPLRDATAHTLRAMAASNEVQVSFGTFHTPSPAGGSAARAGDNHTITLPQVPSRRCELQEFRGRADRHACWHRHHNSHLAPALSQPNTRTIWRQLEQVRVDLYGTNILSGSRDNLTTCLAADLEHECRYELSGPPPITIAALLHQELSEHCPDFSDCDPAWLKRLQPLVGELAANVRGQLNDQRVFTHQVLKLLEALDMITPEELPPEPEESQTAEAGSDAGDSPQSADNTALENVPQSDNSDDDASVPIEMQNADDGEQREGRGEQGETSWLQRELAADEDAYRVYCRAYDRQVAPSELCPPADLRALRAQLDQLAHPYRAMINKLANRLGRIITARQNRRWDYDLDDGLLDMRRLSRVIVSPLQIPPHKRESTQEFPDTVVSLLIDNSGSQRGKAIALAAVSSEIIAATLERCGVCTEILGFTTTAWKGGESRKKWLAAGRPAQPGRLNDLLHIQYKSAGMPWRKARANMGLMLMPDLLKENIDGEALIWAHERLMAMPKERRILMVISDGAPVDDSTLSANKQGYLDAHLRKVVKLIEKRSAESSSMVELAAIGIGHDVNRYYSRAMTLRHAEDLGAALLTQLSQLFTRPIRKQ